MSMLWRVVVAVLLLTVVAVGQTTRPSPITIDHVQRRNPEQRIVVARVDLTDPRVHLAVAAGGPDPDGEGPWETVLSPTSEIAAANGFDLAINTVFFQRTGKDNKASGHLYVAGEWARSMQLLMNDGKVLAPPRGGASLVIEKGNIASIAVVREIVPGVQTIVTGNKQLLFRGRDITDPNDVVRHPRTAIGLTRDAKTLVLLVCDGRRSGWSTGMTMTELAAEMTAQGCHEAINLDGGGSTTMTARQPEGTQKVLNIPSDGSTLPIPLSIERPVPYVFGITVREPGLPPRGN